MELCGYTGKLLHVDLTNREITEKPLDADVAADFIGDYGLCARLAYDFIKPGVEPLSSQNAIIIGAGPLTGTSAPGSGRFHCFTKMPLNGVVGGAGGGQGFGGRLKYAGYDALVITGRSTSPVYLKLLNGCVSLEDAADLCGKDTYETTDRLWKRNGNTCSVITIGQAGENLAALSLAIVNKSSTLGRGGLGAVMGSKNLKALVANGSRGVNIYDKRRFRQVVSQTTAEIRSWPEWREFVELSHMVYDFDKIMSTSGLSDYMRVLVDPAESRKLFGREAYLQRVKGRRIACLSCPIACHDATDMKGGPFHGLHYYNHGVTPVLSLRRGIDSMDGDIKCRDMIQRYGLDYFGVIGQIDFVRELYQKGVISKDDTGGEEFKPGLEATEGLIDKIALRKGIGDVLADGFPAVVRRFGKECERHCVEIKGMDVRDHPAVAKFGARHMDGAVNILGPTLKGGMINPARFQYGAGLDAFVKFGDIAAIPEDAMQRMLNTPMKVNIARLTRYTQDYYAVMSSLGLCIRAHMNRFWPMKRMAEAYHAATGIEMSASRLMKAGERISNLAKMLNVREGFSRKDDRFPARWLEPLKTGQGDKPLMDHFETRVLTSEDLNSMLDDYYDERGWGIQSGVPTRVKLSELGLDMCLPDLA